MISWAPSLSQASRPQRGSLPQMPKKLTAGLAKFMCSQQRRRAPLQLVTKVLRVLPRRWQRPPLTSTTSPARASECLSSLHRCRPNVSLAKDVVLCRSCQQRLPQVSSARPAQTSTLRCSRRRRLRSTASFLRARLRPAVVRRRRHGRSRRAPRRHDRAHRRLAQGPGGGHLDTESSTFRTLPASRCLSGGLRPHRRPQRSPRLRRLMPTETPRVPLPRRVHPLRLPWQRRRRCQSQSMLRGCRSQRQHLRRRLWQRLPHRAVVAQEHPRQPRVAAKSAPSAWTLRRTPLSSHVVTSSARRAASSSCGSRALGAGRR